MVSRKIRVIRKYFCAFKMIGRIEPIEMRIPKKQFRNLRYIKSLVNTKKDTRMKECIEEGMGPYAFFLFEKLFYTTENKVTLQSKKLNISKIYFVNAKLVTLSELKNEAELEAAAEPYTTNDARRALKKLESGDYKQVVQCLNTEYFFEFNPKEHEIL